MTSEFREEYIKLKRALFNKYYSKLNKEQRRAVFTVDGPLLILAGAGSGKTTVLVNRLSHMIRYGNAYMSEELPYNACESDLAEMKLAYDELTGDALSEYLLNHDIPICAHLGLLPQTAENFKQKGRTEEEAAAIIKAAKYVDDLGCFEMVLEHIPEDLGTKITGMVNAVTIGIGGGKFTDGQVLVMHDALGMHQRKLPPFATKFVDMFSLGVEGFKKYIDSVQNPNR